MITDKIKSKIPLLITVAGLLIILYLAIFVRLPTINFPTVLDYDPWWFFRHAKEIVDNGYNIPNWDILSYYPPGRPMDFTQGWSYTIAIFYRVLHHFITTITLTDVAKISPLIMVGLTVFVAFFFGNFFGGYIAGLTLALFSVLAPTFIGISMAGYDNTNTPVVFYMFLSIFSYFLLIKNSHKRWKAIPFYIFSVVVNFAFIFNWGGGWLASILMMTAIPVFFFYKILEDILHQKKIRLNWKYAFDETKPIAMPPLIVILVLNVISISLGYSNIFQSFLGGLGFTGIVGEPLIVNLSVAELQKINIFSRDGFLTITNQVGIVPTLITIIAFPLWLLYKLYRKEKINFFEIFMGLWALTTFYLILTGIRFSLQFSLAASAVASYVISNIFEFIKDKNKLYIASIFGILATFSIMFVSNAIATGYASTGLEISQNWFAALDWLKANANQDSLIATWWDPGHIITGYTGLKVHADGAHCGSSQCYPYNHNIRITDMGRLMTTNNETESVQLLQKYTHLAPEQCTQAKKSFAGKIPDYACNDVKEVYVLATSDLIGKYFWMACFGSFNMDRWLGGVRDLTQLCQQHSFIQIPLTTVAKSGSPVYSSNDITITLIQNNTQIAAVMTAPSQGIRNLFVSDVVYFQNGLEQGIKVSGNNTVDGMVLVDPSFSSVLFMDNTIRDSMFTRMFFFNGQGLNHFQQVYSNSEVKIYKVNFG